MHVAGRASQDDAIALRRRIPAPLWSNFAERDKKMFLLSLEQLKLTGIKVRG